MPPSAASKQWRKAPDGQRLAIYAQALFLVNLMLAPGLAFIGLAWLWFRHRASGPPLARCHLEQAFRASLWAGVLLVAANVAIIMFGGFQSVWTWVVLILWFTCVHSTLILLGIIGLVKAMSGNLFVFPLVGKRCD